MKKIITLLIIIIVTFSCKDSQLTREDAKSAIIQKKGYPQKTNYKFVNGFIEDMETHGFGVTSVLEDDDIESQKEYINRFESLGLLTIEKTPHSEESQTFFGTTVRTWTSVNIKLTELGRKYLVSQDKDYYIVNLWETNVSEITGIQDLQDFKISKVEYIISNTNVTPFGSVFSDQNQTQKKSIDFALYDDGWRIQ